MAANAEAVRSYVEALARGDVDAAGEHLADDAVLHVPGRNPSSGPKEGKEAILSFMRGIVERSGGGLNMDIHDLLSSDDHVVLLGTRSIGSLRAPAAIVYHLDGDKISSIWPHELDQHAVDEVLSGGGSS